MKQSFLKGLIFILLFIFVISCDIQKTGNKIIVNNTGFSNTISVFLQRAINDNTIDVSSQVLVDQITFTNLDDGYYILHADRPVPSIGLYEWYTSTTLSNNMTFTWDLSEDNAKLTPVTD